MTKPRRKYSNQFKIDAVELVPEQGYKISEAAGNLEIHPNPLRTGRGSLRTIGQRHSIKRLLERRSNWRLSDRVKKTRDLGRRKKS